MARSSAKQTTNHAERNIEMTVETKATKEAIHEMLEARIKTVESKLDTLKARAETVKATAEIKAIAELASRRIQLRQKLEELRKTGDLNLEHAKKQVESLVTEFEKAVKDIEAKVHAH
jgi:predicted  nucleic acid-binding Zn-ribbon protein